MSVQYSWWGRWQYRDWWQQQQDDPDFSEAYIGLYGNGDISLKNEVSYLPVTYI